MRLTHPAEYVSAAGDMSEMPMTTRREFMQTLPAVGAAFAVGGYVALDDVPARAQAAPPLAAHFHPKGKAVKRLRSIL
jgi:hypothetical protein